MAEMTAPARATVLVLAIDRARRRATELREEAIRHDAAADASEAELRLLLAPLSSGEILRCVCGHPQDEHGRSGCFRIGPASASLPCGVPCKCGAFRVEEVDR